MERKNISQKLNEIYAEKCRTNPRLLPLVRFYQGETKKKLYETASSLAPQGVVVALTKENGSEETAKDITEGLRGACSKILSVKIPEKTDAVRAAASVLRAAEDARLIVTAEYSLIPLARYAAKISGLTFVYVMRTGEIDGLLSPRLFLKNGNRTDCFFSDARTRVIIDIDKICAGEFIRAGESDGKKRKDKVTFSAEDSAFTEKRIAAPLFAKLAGKIPALADYRARLLATGEKPNAEAYGLLREAVKDGYIAFTKKDREILPSLIYDSLLGEIADLLSDGELCSFSALRFAEFLLAGEKRLSADLILELYARISGVYALYTSPLAEGLPEIPDYRARAHELAEMTGTDEGIFLKGLLKQTEILNRYGENADNITDKLFEELSKQNASASSVRSTFVAYGKEVSGGKEGARGGERGLAGDSGECEEADDSETRVSEEKLKKAIKLAGDSPFGINAMSFAREKGVTEYI